MKKTHLLLLAVIILAFTGKINSQTFLDATQQFVSSYPPNINSTDQRTVYFGLGNITLDATNNFKPDLVQVVNYTLYAPPVQEFHSFCGWNENSGTINFVGNNQIFLQTPPSSVTFNKELAFAKLRSSQVQHPKLKDFVVLKDDALKLFLVNNDASVVEGQSFAYSNGFFTTAGEFNREDSREDVFVYGSKVIKDVTRYFVFVYKANGDAYPYIGESPIFEAEVTAQGLFPKLIVKRINEPDGAYVFGNQSPGKPDLIVKDNNTVRIFSNDDNNQLVLTKTITPGYTSPIFDVAVEDVNNDGYNDIILSEANQPYPRVQIYFNSKSGDFFGNSASITLQNNSAIWTNPSISTADFNVDGFNDLIISSTEKASIFINQSGNFSSSPNQIINHFQKPKQSIATDLNGQGGISLLINGAGAITYNNQQLWDIESITRFNPSNEYSNPAPPPPAISGSYTIGSINHPWIKFGNRGELDFKEYRIYKRKQNEPQFQYVATVGSNSNEFVDYDEIVFVGGGVPINGEKLSYHVKSVDLSDQLSIPSNQINYWVEGQIPDSPVQNDIKPDKYSITQNYPNPFNPVTKINFALPKQGFVTLKIYDITGREVQTLVSEMKQVGFYSVDFNGANLSSGVYFYKIQSGDFISVKRMLLIK